MVPSQRQFLIVLGCFSHVEIVVHEDRSHCFALQIPDRTFIISTEDDADMEAWMTSIIRCEFLIFASSLFC
jgi:hypothetical protein